MIHISQNSKIFLSKNLPTSILVINVKCITIVTTINNLSFKKAQKNDKNKFVIEYTRDCAVIF